MLNFYNRLSQQLDKIKDNKVLSKILGFSTILILIAFLAFLFINQQNYNSDQFQKNPISGEDINLYSGASISSWDKYVKIYSLHNIKDKSSMSINTFSKVSSLIEQFITFSYPQIKTVSYNKDSIKEQGKTYSFKITADTGQVFDITTTEISDTQISTDFYSYNDKIFSFNESDFKTIYTHPSKLALLLPKTFYLSEEKQVTISKDLDGQYQISVESCGDQSIINQAKERVNKWLLETNFNPEEINFLTPNYCDGDGHNHHHDDDHDDHDDHDD